MTVDRTIVYDCMSSYIDVFQGVRMSGFQGVGVSGCHGRGVSWCVWTVCRRRRGSSRFVVHAWCSFLF